MGQILTKQLGRVSGCQASGRFAQAESLRQRTSALAVLGSFLDISSRDTGGSGDREKS